MKRRHEERKITRREWNKHRRIHLWMGDVDCICDKQVGRFRKRDAYDCGMPKCWICHSDKFPRGSWTRQEIRAELRFQEQVREIYRGDP